MSLLDRITFDSSVRFGKPCVRGTRITVGDVLDHLAGGMSESELLESFPQLAREDVRACLAFAAERERRVMVVPTSFTAPEVTAQACERCENDSRHE